MIKGALGLGVAAMLWAGAASATEVPAPAPAVSPAAPAVDPFEQVLTARQVADFARRRKSAQAMIVAARMLQEVKFEDPVAEAKPAVEEAEFTPKGLFDEAETLAKGDPAALAQIRIARNSGRGVLTSAFGKGLVRAVREVGARTLYAFEVQAKAGELLRIGAIGDSTVRMAMRLRDKAGKLLCDDGGDYAPVCSVRPLLAAALRVEILNQSNAATRAVILSN